MPALALVYVEEDLNALVLLDAALEHAGGAALDELVVDDTVGRRPGLHLPSLVSSMGRTPFSRNSEMGRAQDGAAAPGRTAIAMGSGVAAPEPGSTAPRFGMAAAGSTAAAPGPGWAVPVPG